MNTGFYIQSIMGATDNFRLLSVIKYLVFPLREVDPASRNLPHNQPISRVRCYKTATRPLQMASILKIGHSWRAQVRQAGHKSISETFATKAEAVAWGRRIEAEMDARRFKDARGLAHITLKELIEWYEEEIGGASPFGKNKAAVLRMWKRDHGKVALAELSPAYLTAFVRNRSKRGASGVTIAIDLTYLAGVFRSARDLGSFP